MLIPYRAKNPIKRIPFATISIIALNVISYILTTESFLSISEDIVKGYGILVGVTPLYTFITSTFLHGNPLHLIGNMLFLWVFGPSVEDRLGIPKYLGLYFIAGIVGDLLQAAISVALGGKNLYGIGASGCIMGVVGAYWYLYSWSPICCVYWVTWFYRGLADIKAFWVIGYYVLIDICDGLVGNTTGARGGVANFAHLGGVGAGVLICALLRIKRDTEELSEAKALHSDSKDLYNLPLDALVSMDESEPGNVEIIRALAVRALKTQNTQAIADAMKKAGPMLIDKDPHFVAQYIIDMRGNADMYRSIQLLRLAGLLERRGQTEQASKVYTFMVENRPNDSDVETALYRLATYSWQVCRDAGKAREYIAELQRRFPHGEMYFYSNALLKQITGN